MKFVKWIPDILTVLRLLGAVCLIIVEPLSVSFYIVYTASGISDVLDGCIARATGNTSELGAKLDSLADLAFYAVMLIRIFPLLLKLLPKWIWFWVAGILIIRLSSYFVAALKYRRFASLHTYLNKATGLAVFLVPYAIGRSFFVFYSIVICIVATAASAEELIIHSRSREYISDQKSILK